MVTLTCKKIIYNRGSCLYEVEDNNGDIKVLKTVSDHNEIMNEVMIMSNVVSPHVIKGYGHGYCMKPVVGSQIVFCEKKRGALPFVLIERGERSLVRVDSSFSTYKILEHAALGLMALHGANFIHCDIKDGNILLMADGRIVLCDFGISCHVNDACRIERQLCTQGFKPPEALMRNASYYTTAIDIWSLGVVIHTRLFGPPFGSCSHPGRTDENIIINEMIDWYQRGRPTLEGRGRMGDLVKWMMEWSPYDRPTAHQVYETLRSIKGTTESMSSHA